MGASRDLITGGNGSASVTEQSEVTAEIEYRDHVPVLAELAVSPVFGGVGALVGLGVVSGFRRAIDERTAVCPGSGAHLLLDDLPVCALTSTYALVRAGGRGVVPREAVAVAHKSRSPHAANACAGYVEDGVIMTAARAGVHALATGPSAPNLAAGDDALAWHTMPTGLRPDRMRRVRRLDLWQREDGCWLADSFFRDSHLGPDGYESVLHEYAVTATMDEGVTTITACQATAEVLPFQECIHAVPSAERVAGMAVDEVRSAVRRELTGVSTCTHLNDQLRALADAAYLVQVLRERT
jgi:hypothetical protein